MTENFSAMGRCLSILDRLMKMYYEHGLTGYGIGWGQQFYLEYIAEHPGASAQDMVEWLRIDKATATKSVKKLVEAGYIRVEEDRQDRRVHRLYPLPEAMPVVRRIKELHNGFYDTIADGFSEEELGRTEENLERMIGNLRKKVWHRMEREHENRTCGRAE